MNLVGILGTTAFTILLSYIIIQLFTFYDVGMEVYGTYLAFYLFLILSTMVLPTQIPNIMKD